MTSILFSFPANSRSADSEEELFQTKPEPRELSIKPWNIGKEEVGGQLDLDQTSDTASLDLSISFRWFFQNT